MIRAWANRHMNTSNLPLLLVLSGKLKLAQWKLSRKEISQVYCASMWNAANRQRKLACQSISVWAREYLLKPKHCCRRLISHIFKWKHLGLKWPVTHMAPSDAWHWDRKTIGRSLVRIVFISVKIWWRNRPSWHRRRVSNLLRRF